MVPSLPRLGATSFLSLAGLHQHDNECSEASTPDSHRKHLIKVVFQRSREIFWQSNYWPGESSNFASFQKILSPARIACSFLRKRFFDSKDAGESRCI